ncbi:MAG: hypothetical protein GQE15_40405 [Archangiaceae bacterium]|nr:hypothetical protein [Archangiaceae bacterium]
MRRALISLIIEGATRRAVTCLLLLGAMTAHAEGGWLSARGRLLPETRMEAFVGTRSFGAGFLRTDAGSARAGLTFEGVVGFTDRDAELRGARVWQVTQTGFATTSVSLGGAAFIVPDRAAFDLGIGPSATLALSLGGPVFSVDLSLQTGLEVFLRQQGAPRLPQRAGLGLHLRVSEFTVAVMARIGADLFPGRNFVGRGEVMLSVGWLGFDHAIGREEPTVTPVNPQG